LIFVDANIFLYAYNEQSRHHRGVAAWLNDAMDREVPIGLPWISVWAFVRIATNDVVQPAALSVAEAMAIIRSLKTRKNVFFVEAGPKHLELLESLMLANRVRGRSTTDAVLAAMALEAGASLATLDQGMRKFGGLEIVDPLQLSQS
jgi:uncharacterized protein